MYTHMYTYVYIYICIRYLVNDCRYGDLTTISPTMISEENLVFEGKIQVIV